MVLSLALALAQGGEVLSLALTFVREAMEKAGGKEKRSAPRHNPSHLQNLVDCEGPPRLPPFNQDVVH